MLYSDPQSDPPPTVHSDVPPSSPITPFIPPPIFPSLPLLPGLPLQRPVGQIGEGGRLETGKGKGEKKGVLTRVGWCWKKMEKCMLDVWIRGVG